MTTAARRLRFYGAASDATPLAWSWVDQQLVDAGTYWVVTPSASRPHPRPVWGVWHGERLHLSIGTPAIRRVATPGTPVTVHLDSGIDVVIVEGEVAGGTVDEDVLGAYDAKYDWRYDAVRYGPLTTVAPGDVLAWRSTGPAGRDGFQQAGAWRITRTEQ
jgi:hypothetical protein